MTVNDLVEALEEVLIKVRPVRPSDPLSSPTYDVVMWSSLDIHVKDPLRNLDWIARRLEELDDLEGARSAERDREWLEVWEVMARLEHQAKSLEPASEAAR